MPFRTLLLAGSVAAGIDAATPSVADIVVYNAQHESLTKAWIEAFTKETGKIGRAHV